MTMFIGPADAHFVRTYDIIRTEEPTEADFFLLLGGVRKFIDLTIGNDTPPERFKVRIYMTTEHISGDPAPTRESIRHAEGVTVIPLDAEGNETDTACPGQMYLNFQVTAEDFPMGKLRIFPQHTLPEELS